MRSNSIQSCASAYLLTISSVPSVDPSLTMTHLSGREPCATTDWIVDSMKRASLRAGVTSTYDSRLDTGSP